MITLKPIPRALVPVDSEAADRISGRNYDEFQGDEEVRALIQRQPQSVLRVTMPHCDAPTGDAMLEEGGPEALARAAENMRALIDGPQTRVIEHALWVYQITSPRQPSLRQIGLGGLARSREILTESTPDGVIIRNEGVREYKARGRADLIEHTQALIGTVNNAVDDEDGSFTAALEQYADARPSDLRTEDEHGDRHDVWLVTDPAEVERFVALLARAPQAYVADGNHRSAAAALLGLEGFLAVFFPAARMGLAPYNRLVQAPEITPPQLLTGLERAFEVRCLGERPDYQPQVPKHIGLYCKSKGEGAAGTWYELRPKEGTYDPADAVADIDADIVQRHLFDALLGITDPRDERLTFVGGDRDATYLRQRVDDGPFDLAVTLAPVTIEQFIAVCHQRKFMPPKSTWFSPKIRVGLVMALLGC